MKIEIKTALTDFHEVNRERARHYVKYLIREGLPKIRGTEDKIKYIEANRLRGITVEELLDDKNTPKSLYRKSRGVERAVVQLTIEGEFVEKYDSVADAGRAVDAESTNICKALRNENRTCQGFKWMYLEDYIKQGEKVE
jgi:hypothetical protein